MRRHPRADYLVSLVAVLAGLVVIVLFAERHPLRLDLTRERRFTLGSETGKVLRGLAAPVEATAFFREGDAGRGPMKDLLQEYAALSPRFRFRFVDPDRSPGLAREEQIKVYGTTVVAAGERRATFLAATEEELTGAILRVTREAGRTVGFVTGHDEKRLDDREKAGLSEAVEALGRARYEASPIALLREPVSPGAPEAIVLAGPDRDLLPEEREALERYLDGGGALLALVDPGPFPQIERLLAREGVRLDEDVVVDRVSKVLGSDYLVPVVSSYPRSEITKDFHLATYYPVARSVALTDSAPPGSVGLPIVVTGPGSWGERDTRTLLAERKAGQDPTDLAGPLALAVKRDRPAGGSRTRVVVFGDSDFASNAHFSRSGNGDLFQAALAWVLGEEEPAGIRPRDRSAEPLVLSSRQGRFLFWFPAVAVPAVILAGGAALLLRRR